MSRVPKPCRLAALLPVWLGLGLVLAVGCARLMGTTDGRDGPRTRLFIELRAQPALGPTSYVLECEPAGGTLPRPADACARLGPAADDPFAPVPSEAVCLQIYGGPETVTVWGVSGDRQIRATFNRRNGCEMARYQRLMELLGLSAQ